jgi:predicted O-linked N-acetylglucosamine transferase (SPINDLY family)
MTLAARASEGLDAIAREERERTLRKTVESDPRGPDALIELAMLCFETGRKHEAVGLFEQAALLAPRDAILRCNLGNALAATGRPEAALPHFQEALFNDPRLAMAHYQYGNALRDLGRDREAVAAYGLAVGLDPRLAPAERQMALLLHRLGEKEAAVAAYRRSLTIEPDRPMVHFNLGNVLREQGRLEEAAESYRAALRLRPELAAAACNLGHACLAQQRFSEAESYYKRALAADPQLAEAARHLMQVLELQGKTGAAIGAGESLVALAETDVPAWVRLGRLYHRHGQSIQALGALRRGLALAPADLSALLALVPVLNALGRQEEAIAAGRRALAIDPDNGAAANALWLVLRRACRWREAEKLASRVEALTDAALVAGKVPDQTPAAFLLASMDGPRLRRIAEAWSGTSSAIPRQSAASDLRRKPLDHKTDRPLRIGYLVEAPSRDLPLIAELCRRHDPARVEAVLFVHRHGSADPAGDPQTMPAGSVDLATWRSEIAAQRIADETIDILVLNDATPGHTAMAIAARRPAIMQLAWPGFPGTSGASFIDYVLGDGIVTPPQQAAHWSEAICRLPAVYRPLITGNEPAEAGPDREREGLPAEGLILAALHPPECLEPAMFRLWTELAGTVPNAVLWLPGPDSLTVAELKRQATERGGDAKHLRFAASQPSAFSRRRLALADLVLDSFPVNDAAATADALAMAVPVITLRGRGFASRCSASLLAAAGLPELIAEDVEGYRRIVQALAREPAQLAAVRSRLMQARSHAPLFDLDGFLRNLEEAYRRIWRHSMSGRAAEAIDIRISTQVGP